METTKVIQHKRNRIINTGYRLFAINGYKNTTTDMLTKDAGIAKGLLFYYFKSKKDLYMYLYHHSLEVIMTELEKKHYEEVTDFFDFIIHTQDLKWQIMKKYPFILQFLVSVIKEESKEVKDLIPQQVDVDIKIHLDKFMTKADLYKFKNPDDIETIINLITLCSKGAMKNLAECKDYDYDLEREKFQEIILMLKRNFYKEEYL